VRAITRGTSTVTAAPLPGVVRRLRGGVPPTFEAVLFRWSGPNAWTFLTVPPELAPPPTAAWGRTLVRATVDGHTWDTSVWASKEHGTVLAVPAKVRKGKGDGDLVRVSIAPRAG